MAKEGLGGRHTHLNAGANIKDVVHHPGQGAFGPVGDAQQPRPVGRIGHQPATLLLHRQGRQGVGGFPRLGDADRERVGAQRRRRITKFTGIKNACWDTGQLLQQIGTHLGRMAAGTAGQDLDPLHPLKHLSRQRQRHQWSRCPCHNLRQVPGHPKGGRFRLLVDLLEHEMAEAALIRHVLGAAKQAGTALHPLARGVIKLDAQRGE